ncbi:MAG: hypothetical protein RJB13_2096 [Pseudomonadota bacterium]
MGIALAALALTVTTFESAYAQGGKARGKTLQTTKSVKYKKKTEVNFDDATIEGSVKTPFGQSLSSRDQKFDRDFIKVRKHFHDQMLIGAGGLSP